MIELHTGASRLQNREAIDQTCIVSFVASEENERKALTFQLAARLQQQVAETLPIALTSPSSLSREGAWKDRVRAELSCALLKGTGRLVVLPWGMGEDATSLRQAACEALTAISGLEPTAEALPPPQVHVEGISPRSGLGGMRSIPSQFAPLLAAFPGWSGAWTRLAAGGAVLVLPDVKPASHAAHASAAQLEEMAVKALRLALFPGETDSMPRGERASWQRDGQLYARYLQSLLSAVVRACSSPA